MSMASCFVLSMKLLRMVRWTDLAPSLNCEVCACVKGGGWRVEGGEWRVEGGGGGWRVEGGELDERGKYACSISIVSWILLSSIFACNI